MFAHDFGRNPKPQPGTSRLGCEERLKDSLPHRGIDAAPGIGHRDSNLLPGVSHPRTHDDLPMSVYRFVSIRHQVCNQLAQLAYIGRKGWVRRVVTHDFNMAGGKSPLPDG